MRHRRRRIVLSLAVLGGAFLACSFSKVDMAQVKTSAAEHLDCDESIVKVENIDGPSGVARYKARGCGRTTTLDCTETRGKVNCEGGAGNHGTDVQSDGTGDGAGEAIGEAAAGCACGNLFGRSSDNNENGSSGSSSPMSNTPQRNKR